MLRCIAGENKDQLKNIPVSLDEMIAEDDPVIVIDAFAEKHDKIGLPMAAPTY